MDLKEIIVTNQTATMMIELNKVDEIANRLRQYELDNKPRYFNMSYTNASFDTPQLVAERISGEHEFRNRINEAVNTYQAEKIIVEEFNQKAKSVKDPVNTVEILVKDKNQINIHPVIQPQNKQEVQERPSVGNPFEHYGGFDGFKQEIRSELAKEYQLLREQEEKQKLRDENQRLTKENAELNEDNTQLFELNQELSEQVQNLQKYVPENLKIGDVSLTKMLGSILGTATETVVKNIVTRKPEKVKEILGDVAFEQLSGLLDDSLEEEPNEELVQEQLQELQAVPDQSEQEVKHLAVANAIHELNSRIPSSQLGKIQLIYYHFLNEDETINEEKLDEIIQFINNKKQSDNE